MHTSHLWSMVHGQPNESLISRLSPESPFLSELDQLFSNIAFLKYICIVSAYETMRSRPTEASLSEFYADLNAYVHLAFSGGAVDAYWSL